MLKSKYYPDGKIEDTMFIGYASSSWQAIRHGMDLLKKGLIWRVALGVALGCGGIVGSHVLFPINLYLDREYAAFGMFRTF